MRSRGRGRSATSQGKGRGTPGPARRAGPGRARRQSSTLPRLEDARDVSLENELEQRLHLKYVREDEVGRLAGTGIDVAQRGRCVVSGEEKILRSRKDRLEGRGSLWFTDRRRRLDYH